MLYPTLHHFFRLLYVVLRPLIKERGSFSLLLIQNVLLPVFACVHYRTTAHYKKATLCLIDFSFVSTVRRLSNHKKVLSNRSFPIQSHDLCKLPNDLRMRCMSWESRFSTLVIPPVQNINTFCNDSHMYYKVRSKSKRKDSKSSRSIVDSSLFMSLRSFVKGCPEVFLVHGGGSPFHSDLMLWLLIRLISLYIALVLMADQGQTIHRQPHLPPGQTCQSQ